jgi:hypothetical protein
MERRRIYPAGSRLILVKAARDILAVVITQREGCYDKRLTRAAHMLEMALEGFFADEEDRAVLPFPDEYPAA